MIYIDVTKVAELNMASLFYMMRVERVIVDVLVHTVLHLPPALHL